jgi:hypothetical protein
MRPGFVDALGRADRVCVDVNQIVASADPVMSGPDEDVPVFDIRSGEILAGNFAAIVGQWSSFEPGGVAKTYWLPLDRVIAITEGLEVVVEPLDTSDPAETITFGGDGSYASESGAAFWASGTPFPRPGRYRLTATAPGHWGCFEVTV